MYVGLAELRLTAPVSADWVVGRPYTVVVTVWDPVPSLVTFTLNVAVWPAFTVAFRLVLFTSSVLPCGVPPLMASASWTALSVLTRPAPWVLASASMTSAAVAAVSGQDALVPPAAQIGGGLEP